MGPFPLLPIYFIFFYHWLSFDHQSRYISHQQRDWYRGTFLHIARSYATIPIWQRWLLDGLDVGCIIWCNLKIKISRHCNHFSFAVSWSDNGYMMTVGWAWHGRYNLIMDATVVGHGATRPAGNPITMTTTNILSMSDIMVTSLVTQNTALPIDAKQSSTLLYFSLIFLGKVVLVRDNWWAILPHFYRLCPIFCRCSAL